MKKAVFIIGIILIASAIICFGVSVWYDRLGGSVMDGSGSFYAETYRRYLIFRRIAIGFLCGGVAAFLVWLITGKR